MDVYEALYTTRAMRRVKPDPDPRRGATSDPRRRGARAERRQRAELALPVGRRSRRCGRSWRRSTPTASRACGPGPTRSGSPTRKPTPDSADSKQFFRVRSSAQHLGDHFGEVPLLMFGFAQHDPSGGSIFPAVWSAMLAARADGRGLRDHLGVGVPSRRGARDPRRARGRGMEHGVLRDVRVSDRSLGCWRPRSRARGRVSQPVGHAGRLRDPRTALARRPDPPDTPRTERSDTVSDHARNPLLVGLSAPPAPRLAATSRRSSARAGARAPAPLPASTRTAPRSASKRRGWPLRADGVPPVGQVLFATSTPAYADKTNATAVHAALRQPASARALRPRRFAAFGGRRVAARPGARARSRSS